MQYSNNIPNSSFSKNLAINPSNNLSKNYPLASNPAPFPPSSQLASLPATFECPIHRQSARRVCSFPHCTKRALLCEECLFSDPGHVSEHKEFIVLISEFWGKQDEKGRKRSEMEYRERIKKSANAIAGQDKRRIFDGKAGKNSDEEKVKFDYPYNF